MVIDIGSSHSELARALSPLTSYPFIVDGMSCTSLESFTVALTFKDSIRQQAICSMQGIQANRAGRGKGNRWEFVWWQGVRYERQSLLYQELLDRAFAALAQNAAFQRALLATGDAILAYTRGKSYVFATVMTADDFLARLYWIRTALREVQPIFSFKHL